MKSAPQNLSQTFSKLAQRMVQSIKPAFQALASKVQSVKPMFQRTAQAAVLMVTPQPQMQMQRTQAEPPQQSHKGHKM